MKKIQVTSSVKGGVLRRNRTTIKDAIKSFEGKDVTITIQLKRKTRSNPQNAYYWGVIVECWKHLLKETQGEIYSKEETHEFLKVNFNYQEVVNEQTGVVLRTVKSTTANSTTEMEEYHLRCRQAAEQLFGFNIPEPNEIITLNF